ncbi:MFS transporter permease [Microbacterium invictum]|uniref:Magnesium-transporting ATPase (P-type) n=1 Tax=Microbacterium invictum TaxID=515415 RepID=A0AA40SMH9_9MICO|nr:MULTISPECIES: MFS transporter permease [Microbacterium]MBB4138956.1 magnesium-transporting ATPase (P-type) [Microbacterium invictum]
MWLRRVFFRWLLPAAFVLPLWLLIGWIAFSASGWALLWVLVIAIPSVLVGQLVLTLLVRARGTVRASREVSWLDVAGFGVWHLLTIGVGFYSQASFWPLLIGAIVVFIALFWMELWQLFREAKPSAMLRSSGGFSYLPAADAPEADAPEPDVFIVTEKNQHPHS